MGHKFLKLEEWDEFNVPQHLRAAIHTLNDALKICREKVSLLLDTTLFIVNGEERALLQHPRIICGRSESGATSLSALGLLNSALWCPPHRLYVLVDDAGVYEQFGIMLETAVMEPS